MQTKNELSFSEKMNCLQTAELALYKEFDGIDGVIKQFIDAVRPWYIFPELQDRPIVINLWGLTGTGKTSLVQRFVELIRWEPYFHFDMGESREKNWSLRSRLDEIQVFRNGLPLVIGLDEFQHARSIQRNGSETNEPSLRLLWELMDSGKFQIQRSNDSFTYELNNAIQTINQALLQHVKIKNGTIQSGADTFRNCVSELSNEFIHNAFVAVDTMKNGCSIFNNHFVEQLLNEAPKQFTSKMALEAYICKCSGDQLLRFLKGVYQDYFRPQTVDCSKALIIVMGNLDEAYPNCHSFNPDLSADLFYRESQRIQLPQIKSVLARYFRSEQLARLGHQHIIYPALSVSAFKQIIQKKLEHYKLIYAEKLALDVYFDQSIERLIYREGVNPNQGTRPLLSCMHNLLQSPIAQLALFACEQNIKARSLQVEYRNKQLWFHFIGNDHIINTLKLKPILRIENLRRERKDNRQALVAVHESGHAILSMLLLRKTPLQVFSDTVEFERDGLVMSGTEEIIPTKSWIKKQVAVLLGGLCAERLLFGDDSKTLGSDSDLRLATQIIMSALMKNGFSAPAYFSNSTDEAQLAITTYTKELDKECMNWLKESERIAVDMLTSNMDLLLHCAWKLSDKRTIGQKELKNLFMKHANVKDRETWFERKPANEEYRAILFEQFKTTKLALSPVA